MPKNQLSRSLIFFKKEKIPYRKKKSEDYISGSILSSFLLSPAPVWLSMVLQMTDESVHTKTKPKKYTEEF